MNHLIPLQILSAGFKELSWTKKDLDAFIKECKSKYATQC